MIYSLDITATTENPVAAEESFEPPVDCPICGESFHEGSRCITHDMNLGVPGEQIVSVCSSCGSGVTLPILPESRFGDFYRNSKQEAGYGNYDQWRPSGALRPIIAIAKRAHDLAKARTLPFRRVIDRRGYALDVGCGSGEVSLFLRRHGWLTTGIEPDARTSEFARSRGLDMQTGTLAECASEPGSFDMVVFHHVLEHVADPLATLSSAHKFLKPEGSLVICVPNYGSWQAKLFRGRWFSLETPRHRHHFTPNGLSRLVKRAGFELADQGTGVSLYALPASIECAFTGHIRTTSGLSARIHALISLVFLMPLNLLATAVTRRGDVINLVATPSQADGR